MLKILITELNKFMRAYRMKSGNWLLGFQAHSYSTSVWPEIETEDACCGRVKVKNFTNINMIISSILRADVIVFGVNITLL